jgi:hypothetical protein
MKTVLQSIFRSLASIYAITTHYFKITVIKNGLTDEQTYEAVRHSAQLEEALEKSFLFVDSKASWQL